MPKTLDFTLKRAEATKEAQISLQEKWIWEGKPIAQWDDDIKTIEAQRRTVAAKETELMTKRGILNQSLDIIHARTVQAVAMLKVHYKNQPEKLAMMQALNPRGDSRDDVLAEAADLISRWTRLDPSWHPTKDNTLSALEMLCDMAENPQGTDLAEANGAWRTQAELMNTQAAQLEQDCLDWHAAATTVFSSGTPEGELIRNTVPTTSTATHTLSPPQLNGRLSFPHRRNA